MQVVALAGPVEVGRLCAHLHTLQNASCAWPTPIMLSTVEAPYETSDWCRGGIRGGSPLAWAGDRSGCVSARTSGIGAAPSCWGWTPCLGSSNPSQSQAGLAFAVGACILRSGGKLLGGSGNRHADLTFISRLLSPSCSFPFSCQLAILSASPTILLHVLRQHASHHHNGLRRDADHSRA